MFAFSGLSRLLRVAGGFLIAVVIILGAANWYLNSVKDAAYQAGQTAERTHVVDSMTKVMDLRIAKADSDAAAKKQTFIQWKTRYDTIQVTDTVTKDSVVYIRKDLADNTVNSCSDALSTCEVRVSERDKQIVNLRDRIRLDSLTLAAQKRMGRLEKLKAGGIGALVGATAATLACSGR